MGAYLSEPVTAKASEDGTGNGLNYGVSGMQGWRISMEDAHSCLPEFGKEASLFAVFDGHGGAEVAQYSAKHLPEVLKDIESYKAGNFKESLVDAFLKLDESLITEEVMHELKELAGETEEGEPDEAALLNEEANMPIEELLKRMKQGVKGAFDALEEPGEEDDSEEEESVAEEKKANGISEEEANTKNKKDETEPKNESKECVTSSTDEIKENGEKTETNKASSKNETDEEKDEGIDEDEDEEEEEDEDNEEEESDSEGDGDSDDDDEGEEEDEMMMSDSDEVGKDSGTTAILALITQGKLYVANAGDSRCVLSRNGKAVDMSVDHKPEDNAERDRIQNAGGKITSDGRVNGGLNLSRALGDHSYKKNEDLKPSEQIIVAVPDVQETTLTKEDEFMILACDGIWNVMTSQEAVDFVSKRLKDKDDVSLSNICEEMFDHCLAPDTSGDGSGCDNMTCIIVWLNKDGLSSSGSSTQRKRPLEDNEIVQEEKKQKM